MPNFPIKKKHTNIFAYQFDVTKEVIENQIKRTQEKVSKARELVEGLNNAN
jgi:ribosomal protein L7Ae-like RNA K-turn-binding protein